MSGGSHLESQSGSDLVRKDFRNNLVKGSQDLHCQLGLNTSFVDQIIQCIGQRQPEAGGSLSQLEAFLLALCGMVPAATV